MLACRSGFFVLFAVCVISVIRVASRREARSQRRSPHRAFHASDFYIWPGPTLFRVWPNKIPQYYKPQALQKEVQDRSTVWLEFARRSRFRRVTYFRAASGYTYVSVCNAPVVPLPPFSYSGLPLQWNPSIQVSPAEEDSLRLRFARISACYCAAYIRG